MNTFEVTAEHGFRFDAVQMPLNVMDAHNRSFEKEEHDALLAKTAAMTASGRYEPFKTTSIFDNTAQHPEWLGDEPPTVQQLMQP